MTRAAAARRALPALPRARRLLLLGWLCAAVAGCGTPASVPEPVASADAAIATDDAALVIVAVRDTPEPQPAVGGTPHARYGAGGYAGGTRAAAIADAVARDHGLAEQAAWRIGPLGLRCMVYRLPPGADRDAVLAQLARDPRVALAQPQNSFRTLGTGAPPGDAAALPAGPYNDPYVGLQRGFAALDAAAAQRWSQGDGVRVALIDTAVDAAHPDLAGRIATQRDVVSAARPAPGRGERHGTEMAGVIAAVANNGRGIVGIAPQARLLVLRACWSEPAGAGTARCDSFTLAQALDAAIAAGADVINLSLGGPADPLLQRLAEAAMRHGAIVVAALPPSGRREGFPAGVPGVLAVASSDDRGNAADVLAAPGRDILTLEPGGSYGYASGSSLAAAQVSGAVALLRALAPTLAAATVQAWLGGRAAQPADLCAAVRHLRAAAQCAGDGAARSATSALLR